MAEVGQRVSVSYIGKFEDGTIFDRSDDHDDSFDFVVGSGNVIAGFDTAVRDMEIGDTKTITIPPAEAYGEYDLSNIDKAPLEELPNAELIVENVGKTVYFDDENGGFIEAKIVNVDNGVVTFDFNHPMAGKTLIFEIELLDVKDAAGRYTKPVAAPEMPPAPGESHLQ